MALKWPQTTHSETKSPKHQKPEDPSSKMCCYSDELLGGGVLLLNQEKNSLLEIEDSTFLLSSQAY